MCGGAGKDDIFGDDGDDILYGGNCTRQESTMIADDMEGGNGRDIIYTGGSNEQVIYTDIFSEEEEVRLLADFGTPDPNDICQEVTRPW